MSNKNSKENLWLLFLAVPFGEVFVSGLICWQFPPPSWSHSNRAARQSPFEFRPQSHRAMFSHRAYTDKPASGSERHAQTVAKRERGTEGGGRGRGRGTWAHTLTYQIQKRTTSVLILQIDFNILICVCLCFCVRAFVCFFAFLRFNFMR